MPTLLLRNIARLVQVHDQAATVVKGQQMTHLPSLEDAYLLIDGEQISDYGRMADCPERADTVIDAQGGMVFPSWCDSHTHIVYAEGREQEFVMRIQGKGYEEIAEAGGGILNSARKLQAMPEEQLYESALRRLHEVRGYGTGAIEIKSGYGLTTESELKMLRVIRRLKQTSRMDIKATFLGAHAVPLDYRDRPDAYVDLLIDEMLPRIADEGLADYIDVFCDRGFFTPEQTARILTAGARRGLPAKIHANELDYSGGVQVGTAHNARSVDHLECVGSDEIAALLGSDTMPTLLPSTAFFLGLEYAPARAMIDAGLPVALATDYNPGTTPSGKMSFVLSLACLKMKMLPEEAINAATINSAYAMDVLDRLGSIERGKRANVFVTPPMSSVAYLPYAFGSQHVCTAIIAGQVV